MKKQLLKFFLTFCVFTHYSFSTFAQTGSALNFVGSGASGGMTQQDYITIADNGTLDLQQTFTIEAWINVSDAGYNTIIDKGNYQYLFQTHPNGNTGLGLFRANTWVYSAGTIPTNTWCHVAVTYDYTSSTVVFYLNGALLSTHTYNVLPTPDNGPITIGMQDPSNCACNFFDGSMDELRIWNRVLTQCEINTNMNCETPLSTSGLQAMYHFNQGIAGGNNSTITTLTDNSGKGNNGTLVNFARTGTSGNFITSGNANLTSGSVCTSITPVITTQPNPGAVFACFNSTPYTISVAASGTSLSYQWYRNTISSNIGGTLISGATSATYTIPTNVLGTYYYYCVVTRSGCSVTSAVSGANTIGALPGITSHPSPITRNYCLNATATTLSVTATGTGLTYQWYRNTSNSTIGGTLISGATTTGYTPPTSVAGINYFYNVITNVNGCTRTTTVSGANNVLSPITITSFNPTSSSINSVVTIRGAGFTGTSAVSLGGITASSFVVVNSTTITAVVGTGASGAVSVVSNCGTATLGGFSYLATPSITSFTPSSGPVGTLVTIFGSGFSNIETNNKVYLGGIQAVVSDASSNALIVFVPSGASFDKFTVRIIGGRIGQSLKYFDVTQACSSKILQAPISYSAGIAITSVATGDFNNDGIKDLAYTGGNNVYIRLGIGNGNFGAQTTLAATNTTQEVQIADFNGDGNQDLIATNSGASAISLFTGTGLGTFSAKIDLTTGLNPYNAVVADFNRDGNLDIAATNNGASTVSLLMGNGNGTFQAFTTTTVGTGPRGIDAGDLNNDGILDLVVANYASAAGTTFSILIGNGNGTFQPKVDRTTISAGIKFVKIADLNSDGFNDVVVVCNTGSNIARHMGNGTTAMGTATLITNTSNIPNGIALADFNSDGNIDLAITNTAATYLYVANGNGNGTFATPTAYNTTNGSNYIAIGDFDNDGNHDIVTSSNADADVKVLLNKCIPTITNFSPLSGTVGTLVTVSGTNFSNILANNKITLGGVTTIAVSATSSTWRLP